jgi:phosphoribosylanthranilate isomerase
MQDAIWCAKVGANALGFIFYKKSPRFIEPSKAAQIINLLPSTVLPVGIFVNAQREVIKQISNQTRIRAIQLSGDESPEDCEGFSVEVWKAFRIRSRSEVKKIKDYTVSAVLLDGAKGDEYGGSGNLPDFSIAEEMKKYHRVILAGGLTPDNILDALEQVQPFGLDVNSGVEIAPGKKNPKKVALMFDRLNDISSKS